MKFREFSEFMGSDKSVKYELGQFKDPVSLVCLAGVVVLQHPGP